MEKMVKLGPRKMAGSTWDEGGKNEVVQILISHGQALIKSIQFVYAVDGKAVRSEMHGKPYGSKFDIVTLEYPKEYLVSISGRYNYDGLASITFGSNYRKYGPFGNQKFAFGDSPFVYNFKHECSFGGFHGCVSDSRLYRIGVYIKPLGLLDETENETKAESAETYY